MAGVIEGRSKVSVAEIRSLLEQEVERRFRFNRSEDHPQSRYELPEDVSVTFGVGQWVEVDESTLHLGLDCESQGCRIRCDASLESIEAVCGDDGCCRVRLGYYISPAEISLG